MRDIKEWLEERVQSLSPDSDSPQPLGDFAAIEQLARAYSGLAGEESSVFGMATSSLGDIDVEPIKRSIITALERWLTILQVDEAAEVALRLLVFDIDVEVPSPVEAAIEARMAASKKPAVIATAADIEALQNRLESLPELVTAERWQRLIKQWQALSKLVDKHDAFEMYQALEILPAMPVSEIANIQVNLDRPIPNELLFIAAHFSGGVRFGFEYDLSSIVDSPEFPLNRLLDGQGGGPEVSGVLFDIVSLPEHLDCREWEWDNETTEWSTVIPLFKYLNGDYVAIDTKVENEQPVVFMSHEEDCLDPPLGTSFIDFLERWTSVNLIDIEFYVSSPLFEKEGFDANAAGLRQWKTWWDKAFEQTM